MSSKTHLKLTVLVIAAVVAVVATALGLGIRALTVETVAYHTYFDESVQGLEVGSPVKYRGVPIGRVDSIAIAPDRKHIDVVLGLRTNQVAHLDLAETLPELRALLGTQGVTGVKYVDLDFFDPKTDPPPVLPFEPADSYIPSHASLLKGLQDHLEAIGPLIPQLAHRLDDTLVRLSRVLDQIGDEHVPERFAQATDDAADALRTVRRLAAHLDRAHLDTKTAEALDRAAAAARRIDALVAKLDGLEGNELDRTVRELGDAARSVRELADAIQRDPDILVKGRARSNKL
jgi:ABC-type transporter Mla subunit MlaD